MSLRRLSLLAVIVLAMTVAYADEPGPANVILEGGCTVGWIGCNPTDAIPQEDGSFDCPISKVGIIPITGEQMAVDANSSQDTAIHHCSTRIEFGQVNPLGTDGLGGYAVAVRPEVICLFFPKACRGNGAVIANFDTIEYAGSCTVFGTVTYNYQLQITPSGRANLACFLLPGD